MDWAATTSVAHGGARTEVRLDGYGRKRRHALLFIDWTENGMEFWAQTHAQHSLTHTKRKPPKKKP